MAPSCLVFFAAEGTAAAVGLWGTLSGNTEVTS